MTYFADAFKLPYAPSLIGNRFGVHDIENGRDLYGPQGHRGVDFEVSAGTLIPVIGNGIVWRVAWSNALGNITVVRHYLHGDNNDVYSGYAHQSVVSVKPGQEVARGQSIGSVGATGTAATGPHLHLTLSREAGGILDGPVLDPVATIEKLNAELVRTTKKPVFTSARRGEGLWVIAQRSHITLPAIEKLNPDIKGPDFLVLLGQKVRIQ